MHVFLSGVNSVQVGLLRLSMMLLSFVHLCKYGFMYAMATILLVCVDVMVMAYVYEVSCSGAGWCGISDLYILMSVGE